MSENKDQAMAATPPADLREQIMSASVPKNEREWWAMHHIESLERQLSEVSSNLGTSQKAFERILSTLNAVIEERDTIRSELEGVRGAATMQLAKLGAWAISTSREDFSDIDAGDLQDMAQGLGVLVQIEVREPCGDGCRCVEYYGSDFPVECLRYSGAVAEFMKSLPHNDPQPTEARSE